MNGKARTEYLYFVKNVCSAQKCQLVVTIYYKLCIRIVVQQFTHLTPYDPTRSWRISDFRQEKIACILVGLDKTLVNDICN